MREYVEMSRPMLRHVASFGDQFREADQERRVVHEQALASAMDKAKVLLDQANGQQSMFYDLLEALGQDLDGTGVTSVEVCEGPPTCNTGVRFSEQVQKREGGSGA